MRLRVRSPWKAWCAYACAAAAFLSSVLLATSSTTRPFCDTTKEQRQDARNDISAAMEGKGFAVANGLFECLEESGGAGAGNPESNSCFVMFNQSNNLLNDKAKYVLQLEDRDAVLYLGCNPNAVHAPLYYGWSPYLFGFDIFHGLKGLPGGQLGDSLNQLTLNSTLRSSKTLPFGGTSAVIVTADETTASDIIDALPKLYREKGAINVLTVPSAELNVELGRGIFRNFFAFGCRAGPFPNKQARNQHATQALEQVLFFSQRLSRVRAPPRPLVTPPRRSKAMPKGMPTEREMLNASLAALITNVETFAQTKGLKVQFKHSLAPQLRDGVPSNGTECVTNRSTTGCALDTDDAAYFDSPRLASCITA